MISLALPFPVERGKAPGPARRQRGVSLLFALIAMVALALAAIALSRSVNTGALIAGNLGFKQDALLASAQASEQAVAWIEANFGTATLNNDAPASAYYATSLDALDPTGNQTGLAPRAVVDWNGDGCASVNGVWTSCIQPSATITVNGNSSRYVITRLCATAGAPSGANSCTSPLVTGSADDPNRGSVAYPGGRYFGQTGITVFYRIVVRTVGPRGTTSYTETIIQT
jgi:type IV pilus assembly protein PilX